jgi:hypothetical protein
MGEKMIEWYNRIKNLFKKDIRPKCPKCKRIFDYIQVKPVLGKMENLQCPIVGCTGCN